jgi:uncharacterized membrane protein
LFPVTTAWVGEAHTASAPSALYGVVLLMAAIAYWMLQSSIIAGQGSDSLLKKAVGDDWKGKSSGVLYLIGVVLSFWRAWAGQCVYLLTALMWLIPDRRIERVLATETSRQSP